MAQRTASPSNRTWRAKFGDAFAGLYWGILGQSSFAVHFLVALAVAAAGFVFHITNTEWCAVVLCIAMVMAAEMFNSALERLAQAITEDHNVHVGRALDMASAAVLITAIGSVVVGMVVFLPHVLR